MVDIGVNIRLIAKARKYAQYGGKGIRVCDSWRKSFNWFLEDVGPRPSKRLILVRDNINGDYEPGNCMWGKKKRRLKVFWRAKESLTSQAFLKNISH